jgi:FixJ family two-component response regulator
MRGRPMISVVDDDDSVRESLQGLIRSLGLAVRAFASAEEFLSAEQFDDTDCLILDVRLPGMTGLELQRRLISGNRQIPIVFITAHDDEAARSQAVRDGAVDYLFKPFPEDALLKAINTALNRADKGSGTSAATPV